MAATGLISPFPDGRWALKTQFRSAGNNKHRDRYGLREILISPKI